MKVILASASPRRAELLSSLGLKFEINKPDVVEHSTETEPGKYTMALASLKSHHVANEMKNSDTLIIASDTIVYSDKKILEKPKSKNEAVAMLRSLLGKSHEVYTAVSCLYQNKERVFFEKTIVEFRNIDDGFLNRYVDSGDSMDKAGAYGIQGQGQIFIKSIIGTYPNVMGLPTSRLYVELKEWLGENSPV